MKKSGKARSARAGETQHSRKLRRRLIFFVSLTLVVAGAVFLFLTALGFFSPGSRILQSELGTRLEVVGDSLQRGVDLMTAHSLHLADEARSEIENLLLTTGTTFDGLNNNPARLTELQQALFPSLSGRLRESGCSGAYIILNATANTDAPNAAHSRSGLYLRCVNLTDSALTDPEVSFFRGIPAVARHRGMEFNNRWNMECDISLVPGVEELMEGAGRPADSGYWTGRIHLKDTWENVVLLCVPIVGHDGRVYGVCGMEISSLIFRLFSPVQDTEYGPVTTVLAPVRDGKLMLPEGLIGSAAGTYLDRPEPLTIHHGKSVDTFAGENGDFAGVQRVLDIPWKGQGMQQWSAALLLPGEYSEAHTFAARQSAILKGVGVLAALAVCMALLYLGFLYPLGRRSEEYGKTDGPALLVSFLRSRPISEPLSDEGLPEEVRACLDRFSARVAALPNDEWRLYRFLAGGCTAEELPARTGLGKRAVRRSLQKLCARLGVESTEDILLYLDFLRRCGREPQAETAE